MHALDLARQFEDSGVAALIFTDIYRDGTHTGPNIAATREIAEALTITEHTVKNHLRHILDKLHLKNRVQAAVFAVREGLADGLVYNNDASDVS